MSKPFHVVFVSPHCDPLARPGELDSGGQCIYEYELAKSLSNLPNVWVTIYCRKKFGHPFTSYINHKCVVRRIACGGDKFIPKEELGPYLDEFAQKVTQDLRVAPSVVHGHYWDGGKAALLIDKYFKKSFPILWTPHSVGTIKRRHFIGIKNEIKYKFVSRIAWETFIMVQSDLVVVSTENEKHQLEYDYGIFQNKIAVIPPGINLNNFPPADKAQSRRALGLPPQENIIMSLGRLDRRKGYHHCIDAFAILKKKFKVPAKLVFFSGGNQLSTEEQEYLRSLKALAITHQVAEDILFRPALDRDKVNLAYAASDIYMCLSDYEPFGLCILEAAAMGVPVMATNNGGPVDIITDEVNGLLVEPTKNYSIAAAAFELLDNQKKRKSIITNARKHIKNHYTWENKALEFYRLYEQVSKNYYHKKRKDFQAHIAVL